LNVNESAISRCALALALALPLSALLGAGCSKKGEGGPKDVAKDGPKVAFLLSTLQEERYKKDQRYFEDAARRLGLSAFTLSADNDNARQLGQVEDALARGARVLVIQATDSAAAAAYVGKAHERGAQVVAYDRDIRGGASGGPDFYVAHDAYRLGVLQAEAALRATSGQGNYVLLNGQSGHGVVTEIVRGYMDVLKPALDKGAVRIVAERNHDAWSPDQALKTVEDALVKQKGDIQAILANNSGMARGAVQAVAAAGKKGIFIAGSDADAANINYLCQGAQAVEILKEIKPLAEKAAEVAAALARGQAPQAEDRLGGVPVIRVPVHLVTPEKIKALVLDSGFHPQSALPACKG
jgi:D-xylose transport system substrate-binding protein